MTDPARSLLFLREIFSKSAAHAALSAAQRAFLCKKDGGTNFRPPCTLLKNFYEGRAALESRFPDREAFDSFSTDASRRFLDNAKVLDNTKVLDNAKGRAHNNAVRPPVFFCFRPYSAANCLPHGAGESETGKPALRKKQRRRAASPRRTKTASGAAGTLPRHSCARPGRTGLRPPSAAKRSPGAPPQRAAASAMPLRRSVVALLRGKDRRASAGEPRPPNEKASFCRRLRVRTMPGARQTDAAAILWSSAAADPRSDL